MGHVTIVGGGIAGLATAFYLQQKSREKGNELQYTIIESASDFGGKIVTENVSGFTIEGGPDLMLTQKPWGIQLCRDLGLTDQLISTNDNHRHTFLVQRGNLVPFPNDFTLLPTRLMSLVRSPMFSVRGKLRIGMDLVIPPRRQTGDESLANFVRRRFGAEAVEKIGGPLLAAIHHADPEKLSLLSTFPRFAVMEQQHGSLIRAMRAQKRTPPSNRRSPVMFNSLRSGLGEMVRALVEQLRGDLVTGQPVTRLRPSKTGCEVEFGKDKLHTNAVVLAVPAYAAAKLVMPFAAELANKLNMIRYVSTGTVSLGYRKADVTKWHDLNGFGFLVPRSEGRRISGCTWSSSKLRFRAPDDRVLMRAFIGGPGQEKMIGWDDDTLIRTVQDEINDIMGVSAEPTIKRIYRWPRGTAQYDVGHLDRIAEVETLADQVPGLYLNGSAYRGTGIPNCVKSAIDTVSRILRQEFPAGGK